ncbi:MAG: type II toxin-antitoxin system Phd/YefM family antitoxin [Gaiellaceae bacterium]
MERIGIRELRQHASRWVRRAAAGETLEITDRGRPVARLQPIPEDLTGIARLRAEGRITEAEGDLLDRELIPPKPGVPPPSEILAALREHER